MTPTTGNRILLLIAFGAMAIGSIYMNWMTIDPLKNRSEFDFRAERPVGRTALLAISTSEGRKCNLHGIPATFFVVSVCISLLLVICNAAGFSSVPRILPIGLAMLGFAAGIYALAIIGLSETGRSVGIGLWLFVISSGCASWQALRRAHAP